MAVSTTDAYSGPYLANGVTTVFPFSFSAPSVDEVSVVLVDDDGAETPAAGYSVELSPAGGGSATFAVAPPAGWSIYVLLDPQFTQELAFENGSAWSADPVNEGYDRSAFRDQALKRELERAPKFPRGETGGTLPSISALIGKFLAVDAAGNWIPSTGTGADDGLRGDLTQTDGNSGARLVGLKGGGSVQDAIGYVTPEMFGAAGDGSTDDRAAFVAARIYAIDHDLELWLLPGRVYNMGSMLTDPSGVTIVAAKGAKLIGNVDLSSEIIAPKGLLIGVNSAGVIYDYWVGGSRELHQKGLWISEGDVIREDVSRINCTGLLAEQVSWPSGDSWTAHTPVSTSADAFEFDASAGNIWYGAFHPAKAGQQIRAVFESGSYMRGAIVRWSGGYVVLYGVGTSCQVSVKNDGEAVVTSNLTWPGIADHDQWSLDNAEWGIRVYDLETVGFVVNGYEVYRASFLGLIEDIGFGVFANASAVTPAVSYWAEVTGDHFRGQSSVDVRVFGDSLSAPFASGKGSDAYAGSWLAHLREALDFGRHGIRVSGWNNYAVAGENSADMVTRFNANGVGSANIIILCGGTNDVQGGSSLSATVGNFNYMLNAIVTAGRKPMVVIPGLWLNADQGAQGFATANAEQAAPMRAALRSLAGQYGALIADLTELEGQILESYYDTVTIADGRKRDRIHETGLAYRVFGDFFASIIAGYMAKQVNGGRLVKGLPTAWLVNGWTLNAETPSIEVSKDGFVSLSGPLDAGTKTDGTIIINLPQSLRPVRTRRYLVNASSTTTVRVEINTDGEVSIYGVQAGDSYIILDGIGFPVS